MPQAGIFTCNPKIGKPVNTTHSQDNFCMLILSQLQR